MRNLIIGALFGAVAGAVIGATLIGPQLVEQIPGFAQRPNQQVATVKPSLEAAKTPSAPSQPDTMPGSAPPPAEPPASPSTWRMASAYGSSKSPLGDLAKRLEHQIARLSAGNLQIRFHEPGALVTSDQMFDAVRSGTIEAAFGSPEIWASKVPALSLFASVPFGPTAQEFLAWFYFSGGQKIHRDIYRRYGLHSLLCGAAAPEASGWFKYKIETVEDLNGLRMRIAGLGARVMAKLGTETLKLTDGDVIVALEAGALDAAEFSQPSLDLGLDLHKRAAYYYFPGWHQPTTLFELLINLEAWQALPAAQQAQIASICGDNVRHSLAQSEAMQFKALKELVSRNVSIQSWPTEVLDRLQSAWRDVVAEDSKKNQDFKRLWASLKRFREEYEIWQELSRP